jgi:hypothetical protein
MLKQVTLLLCLMLTAAVADAARLNNLFQAEVEANGRTGSARDAALGEALAVVLVRLTGSREALGSAQVREWLAKPGRFVQQYRFNEQPPAGKETRLTLWVQFDGVDLARELRAAGLPYWGQERPDLIAWLAIDDKGRRYLLSESDEQDAAKTLRESSTRFGLPLTLPLLDLEDQGAIRFTDVWGGFTGTIEAASARYRPQVILTGRVDRTSVTGDWRAEWQLLDSGTAQSWSGHAATLDDAIADGAAEAAGLLALRYAAVAADSSLRTLVVDNVQSLSDYARLSDYLKSLSPVERVELLGINESQVEFAITLGTDERNLLQIIRLGKVLQSQDGLDSWRFRLHP